MTVKNNRLIIVTQINTVEGPVNKNFYVTNGKFDSVYPNAEVDNLVDEVKTLVTHNDSRGSFSEIFVLYSVQESTFIPNDGKGDTYMLAKNFYGEWIMAEGLDYSGNSIVLEKTRFKQLDTRNGASTMLVDNAYLGYN